MAMYETIAIFRPVVGYNSGTSVFLPRTLMIFPDASPLRFIAILSFSVHSSSISMLVLRFHDIWQATLPTLLEPSLAK